MTLEEELLEVELMNAERETEAARRRAQEGGRSGRAKSTDTDGGLVPEEEALRQALGENRVGPKRRSGGGGGGDEGVGGNGGQGSGGDGGGGRRRKAGSKVPAVDTDPPSTSTDEEEGYGERSKRPRKTGRKEVKSKTVKGNSELFSKGQRPHAFKSDELFDILSYAKAAQYIMNEHLLQQKKKLKAKPASATTVKVDDTLPEVILEGGSDDATSKFCWAAQNLRPINDELKPHMRHMNTKHVEIVRGLPLEIFGLSDTVSAKAIELAHDLANSLNIKSPKVGGAEQRDDDREPRRVRRPALGR